jgi:hypothetical protein
MDHLRVSDWPEIEARAATLPRLLNGVNITSDLIKMRKDIRPSSSTYSLQLTRIESVFRSLKRS